MRQKAATAVDWDGIRRRFSGDQQEIDDERAKARTRALLLERTRQLAARSSGPVEDSRPVLMIEAGGERFALHVSDAAEVAAMTVPTILPRARSPLIGVVDRRGILCRVYDLAALCGLPPALPRQAGHLVVLRAQGRQVGLRVDRALTIAEVAAADLRPSEDTSPATLGSYTEGGLNLLDPQTILSRIDGAFHHVA